MIEEHVFHDLMIKEVWTTSVMKQLGELIAQLLAGKVDEAIVHYPVAA